MCAGCLKWPRCPSLTWCTLLAIQGKTSLMLLSSSVQWCASPTACPDDPACPVFIKMEEDLDYSVLLTTVAPSFSACPEDLACPDANYAAPLTLFLLRVSLHQFGSAKSWWLIFRVQCSGYYGYRLSFFLKTGWISLKEILPLHDLW